ncbi:Anti-sigma factor antagonist [Azospirillaceae bacterium]
MSLTYTLRHSNSHVEVFLNGDFTFAENITFRLLVEELIGTDATSIAIDLSKLRTVDSAGLSMLVLLRNRLDPKKRRITLLKPPPQIERVLEVVEFSTLFDIRL